MASLTVEALVLAGADSSGGYRPLKPLLGKPMISYVLDTLRGCSAVTRLGIAGPEENLEGFLPEEALLLPSGSSAIDTLEKALKHMNPQGWLLVVTADVPLLSPVAVEDFLASCEPLLERYDFFYSLVRREVCEEFCPQGHRTYACFREGQYTGGNIFLVHPSIVASACQRGGEILRLRKSPMRLARLIGPWFLLRYLLHCLPLAEAENRFSSLLALRGVTVVSPYAEVGFDLDRPEQFALAEKILQGRQLGGEG